MERGTCAEFESAEAIVAAARRLRAMGFRRLDAFTPFPLRELDETLSLRRSPIPWLVLGGWILGAAFAYLLQYWCAAIAYPLNVGGRPLHSAPAFIPITFETSVLFASLTAFVAVLAKCGLPRLHHPLFEVSGFERTSIDRFWLAIDAADPHYEDDEAGLGATFASLGALRVERFGDGRSAEGEGG